MQGIEPAALLVEQALSEDLGGEINGTDLTCERIVPMAAKATAHIIARQKGVIAGLYLARTVFAHLDPTICFDERCPDGATVCNGDVVARIAGKARPILTGERTALNFLQHLSGIATQTRTFVEAVTDSKARITDTRKTTPGLRRWEKRSVVLGGGVNHRFGLYDAVLIKENHAAMVGGIVTALRRARRGKDVPVFVEVRDLGEVASVLQESPQRIMLDNMSSETMRQAVDMIQSGCPSAEIEATGGVTLETVRSVATTGVDFISIGALTHSAPALDLSMLFDTRANA